MKYQLSKLQKRAYDLLNPEQKPAAEIYFDFINHINDVENEAQEKFRGPSGQAVGSLLRAVSEAARTRCCPEFLTRKLLEAQEALLKEEREEERGRESAKFWGPRSV